MTTALARRFSHGEREFATSPLYQRLCEIVTADDDLLALAAHCRPGQQVSNMLFAAVQYLLLGLPRPPELARWYRSLDGDRDPDDGDLAAAFRDFCRTHRAELVDLLSTRLVQTNQVKRSAVLRIGLAVLAATEPGPVTLLEVGASGGIHLCFDRYRCRIGGTLLGPADSPVLIETEWRSTLPVPDASLAIAGRLGVDLDPVDLTDERDRRWLRALVWPENLAQAELLAAAMAVVADRPYRIVAGDAIDVLPALDAELPTDRPLVVWHAATRAHVPTGRRAAFDAAIAGLGARRPLHVLSLESPATDPEAWYARHGFGYALVLRSGAGRPRPLAAADGHAGWITPVEL